MKKKGVAIPYLIMMLIGIIVMVVIVSLLRQRASQFSQIDSCEARGGKCLYPGGIIDSTAECGKGTYKDYTLRTTARNCKEGTKKEYGTCCIKPIT